MTDADAVTIHGWENKTSSGSTVWVGLHGEGDAAIVCFRFINAKGEDTKLAMGVEAARAMCRLTEKVLPPISDPHYKMLVKFVGEAAEKLGAATEHIWKVVEEPSAPTQPAEPVK